MALDASSQRRQLVCALHWVQWIACARYPKSSGENDRNVWHFASKTASGVAGMLAGALLSFVGFEADVEQSETAKTGILMLMSGIPLLTYGTGIWLFRRFALTRETHEEIRRELDARVDSIDGSG